MATIWSVILNRKDQLLQQFWTEWRALVVSVSSGAADAGAIPMLDPSGKIDPSMIHGGATGTEIEVNGVDTVVQSPINFEDGTDISVSNPSGGNVKFDFTGTLPQTFTPVLSPPSVTEFLTGYDAATGLFSAAGSGGLNSVRAAVDFGRRGPDFFESDEARTTVTGQPWVTANSKLLCQPAMVATPDHDPDDVWVEEITAYTDSIVPGVGFDVIATCPNGTWGQYLIDVIGGA